MTPDPKSFPFCSEFLVLEKTVQVVVQTKSGDSVTIRIEAFRSSNEDVGYTTREEVRDDKRHKSWNFPWTSGQTADEAIAQSLAFIREKLQ